MTGSKKPSTPTDSATLSFEDAIGELESIIGRVEKGEIGIEQALTQYERGVKLVSRCREILTTVEQRIEELESNAAPDENP